MFTNDQNVSGFCPTKNKLKKSCIKIQTREYSIYYIPTARKFSPHHPHIGAILYMLCFDIQWSISLVPYSPLFTFFPSPPVSTSSPDPTTIFSTCFGYTPLAQPTLIIQKKTSLIPLSKPRALHRIQ